MRAYFNEKIVINKSIKNKIITIGLYKTIKFWGRKERKMNLAMRVMKDLPWVTFELRTKKIGRTKGRASQVQRSVSLLQRLRIQKKEAKESLPYSRN